MAQPVRPTRRDCLVALAVTVPVALGTWRAAAVQDAPRELDAWAIALTTLASLALAARRAAPVVALGVAVGGTSLYLLAGYPYGPVLLCVGWAMFEVARLRPWRWSSAAGGVAALVLVAAATPRLAAELDELALGLVLWCGLWLALPWSLGTVVAVRNAADERSRQELATRAALEERIRLAREVHDIAGHGFAVIAMQAGVAALVVDEQPEQVRAALAGIRDTASAALDELRGALQDRPVAGPAALGDLPGLVRRAEAAGLPVELQVDLQVGDLVAVDPQIADLAYRVVRESLTNVIRHAGDAGAVVALDQRDGLLSVSVTDSGAGAAVPAGPGQGLDGLRARVEAAGGTFTAGPREQGFAVLATLPVAGRR